MTLANPEIVELITKMVQGGEAKVEF